jgi:hypothetical protein
MFAMEPPNARFVNRHYPRRRLISAFAARSSMNGSGGGGGGSGSFADEGVR